MGRPLGSKNKTKNAKPAKKAKLAQAPKKGVTTVLLPDLTSSADHDFTAGSLINRVFVEHPDVVVNLFLNKLCDRLAVDRTQAPDLQNAARKLQVEVVKKL